MVTLTFDSVSLDFFSWREAAEFIQTKVEPDDTRTCFEDLDFREVPENELTPELIAMAEEVKHQDPSTFINIR
jgi:hypothetical protein